MSVGDISCACAAVPNRRPRHNASEAAFFPFVHESLLLCVPVVYLYALTL